MAIIVVVFVLPRAILRHRNNLKTMNFFQLGGAPPLPSFDAIDDDLDGSMSIASSIMTIEESAHGSDVAGTSNLNGETPTPQSIDALLARELNQLTFQEREGIHEEVHGVYNSSVDETPDFVERKLAALEREIQMIPVKPAYDRAVLLNSGYVRDVEGFRLPFLRAEHFQEKLAARRMVKYLAFVLEVHGEVALMRPTYLSDLTEADRRMLNVGVFQLLPGRDRSGRRIFGAFDDIPAEFPLVNRVSERMFQFQSWRHCPKSPVLVTRG